jgi:hypothetical protein
LPLESKDRVDFAGEAADLGVLVFRPAGGGADTIEGAEVERPLAAEVRAGLLQVDLDRPLLATGRLALDGGVGHAVGGVVTLDRDADIAVGPDP